MKTLVEFYDQNPILNVLSITLLKPECAVFLMGRDDADSRDALRRFFARRPDAPKLVFYSVSEVGIDRAYTVLEDVRQALGDVVIDVTGGRDDFLFAAGMFCKARGVPALIYDEKQNRYREMYEYPGARDIQANPHFTVADFLCLAGGALERHGHIGDDELTQEVFDDITAVWRVFTQHQKRWARHTQYIQYASREPVDALTIRAPESIRGNDGRTVRANLEILNALKRSGALTLERDGGELTIRYHSALIKRCMCDVGIWLEMYTYLEAKRSSLFDDVKISVVIDWNGRRDVSGTLNELDVALTRGVTPVFISCKSGAASVMAINEVHVLASMFGGEFAKAVLVTMDTPSRTAPALYRRAMDLGVAVVEGPELVEGKLIERLRELLGLDLA